MTDRPDVRLEIGSELYGGWKRISIRRALGRVAGTFDLNVTERWPGQDVSRPIQPGAACRVLVDGLAVITGYVDDVRISCSASEHSVTVRGRDKTGDLVDCCAPSMQLAGASLAVIARNLCAPFGIEVVDGAGADTVPGFKINPGDTVFETLDQLARAQGVFLTTDGEGRLVLARAGREKAGTVLELGKNVMESRGSFSMADRYSEITVLGQTAASDTWDGAKAGRQKTVVRGCGRAPLPPSHPDCGAGMAGREQPGAMGDQYPLRQGQRGILHRLRLEGRGTGVDSEHACFHTRRHARPGGRMACRRRDLFTGRQRVPDGTHAVPGGSF